MSEQRLGTTLQTVDWREGRLVLIDQNALPHRLTYITYTDWRDVVEAIRTMVVRGAPAIGCTAALGMALGAQHCPPFDTGDALLAHLETMARAFRSARPTAVNLFWAVDRILAVAREASDSVEHIRQAVLDEGLRMLEEDIQINRRLGHHGAQLLPQHAGVLTHCNAGALATVGYGTALGVVRAAVELGKTVEVYADETRPRLQGMKLTAWELAQDSIPVTIIADNMAAVLMREGKIDCVIVGADRIAANGDTANKIGTYGLAVLAHYHGVPFYVAAPVSTFDLRLPSGNLIPIEQRDPQEVTHIQGNRIAPEGVPALHPAFAVTPAELIHAFITEIGVLYPPFDSLRERLTNDSNSYEP